MVRCFGTVVAGRAWARDSDADAATVEEHGGKDASGSMVRPLPSFEHPAGSHLRLLGVSPGSSGRRMCRAKRQAHRPFADSAAAPGIRNHLHICG